MNNCPPKPPPVRRASRSAALGKPPPCDVIAPSSVQSIAAPRLPGQASVTRPSRATATCAPLRAANSVSVRTRLPASPFCANATRARSRLSAPARCAASANRRASGATGVPTVDVRKAASGSRPAIRPFRAVRSPLKAASPPRSVQSPASSVGPASTPAPEKARAPIRARPAMALAEPSNSIRPTGAASNMPCALSASPASLADPFQRSSPCPSHRSISAVGAAIAMSAQASASPLIGPRRCGRPSTIATSSHALTLATPQPAIRALGMAAASLPRKPDFRLPLPSIYMPTAPASVSSRNCASRR